MGCGPETSRMSVVVGLFLPAPRKAATRAAGPAFTRVAVLYFWSRARPEKLTTLLSGPFRALSGVSMAPNWRHGFT